MINFPVNIFKEHFYINGHVFQFSYCLVKGAGSHALPALMNTGCGLHQRQRSCVSLLWGLQCTCSTQRAGKIEMANPHPRAGVIHRPPPSLPPCLPSIAWPGIFPVLLCLHNAKGQAGFQVLLFASKSSISSSLGKESLLHLLAESPAPWHVRQTWGSLNSCCGGRPTGRGCRVVPDIWQTLRHPMLDTSFRAWSSWEVLSWPSVSIFLLHLNIEVEVAVIRLHLALFWGTPRAHYTF